MWIMMNSWNISVWWCLYGSSDHLGRFFCFGWVPAFSFPGLLLTPFMFSSNVIYLIPCIGPVHVKYHFMHFICICVHIWHVLSSILYYFFTFFPNVWPDFPAPGSFLLGIRSLTIRRRAYRGRPTALLMDGDGQGAREPLGALRNSGEWKKHMAFSWKISRKLMKMVI